MLVAGILCKADFTVEKDLYAPLFDPFWEKPVPAPRDLDVILRWEAHVETHALNVSYTIENTTKERIQVLHRDLDVDHRAAHVDFNGTGLVLSIQTLPKPITTRYFEYSYAQPTPVEPNGVFHGQFRVELPAVVNFWTRQHWMTRTTMRHMEVTPTRARRTNRVTLMVAVGRAEQHGEMMLGSTIVLPEAIDLLDYETRPRTSPSPSP